MMEITATVLAGLVAAAVILMGCRAFWAPEGAVAFGIPGTPAKDRAFHAWIAVKGVRDIACGVFLAVLLVLGPAPLMGWFMLNAAGIPAGDAVIVLRSRGPRAAVYGIHGPTALTMLGISLLLLVVQPSPIL